MLNYLRQHKWYREIFSNNLYYKINGTWIKDSGFKIGDRIENVDGPWRSLYFCDCGNELSHSDSYINKESGAEGVVPGIWEYKCTYCDKHQYANGTLGPFILECDKNGSPIKMKQN